MPAAIRASTVRLLAPLALLLTSACNQNLSCLLQACGAPSPPPDRPGTLSYYAEISFTNNPPQTFCFPNDQQCIYDVRDNFAAPLQSSSWVVNTGMTDADYNGTWTTPDATAAMINGEHPNLLYVFSHGGVIGGTDPQICLRNCDGSTWGNDYSFGTQTLPQAWNGPNWLVLDACDAVVQTTAWDPVFGGSLHGILGWNNNTLGGLGDAGYATFDKDVAGYDTAINAWEQATSVANSPQYMSMLIPNANSSDRIEAAGGPHFGYNGDTSPEYYFMQSDGTVGVVSPFTLSSAPQSVYSLVPESMNESYWYNYYGGSSVPSTITHPSGNENLYRSQYVTVDHYLASGGVVVSTERTGTARGFAATDAYQYAANWIQNNGGLPNDASLEFAGEEVQSPNSTPPTSDQPYPNRTRYLFTWRHASSAILSNDKITIAVDDAGSLTTYSKQVQIWNVHCRCYVSKTIYYQAPPWVPVYHLATYVRVWRTLGSPTQSITPKVTASSYAYCASDMYDASSVANPCGVNSSSGRMTFIDLVTGRQISAM